LVLYKSGNAVTCTEATIDGVGLVLFEAFFELISRYLGVLQLAAEVSRCGDARSDKFCVIYLSISRRFPTRNESVHIKLYILLYVFLSKN